MLLTRQMRFIAICLLIACNCFAAEELSARARLELSFPVDYQVHQRATREQGKIVVAGRWPEGSREGAWLEVKLIGGGHAQWQQLFSRKQTEKEFHCEFNAPAGGWYRLEAQVRQQAVVSAEAAVEHVGVGEVFVIAGQSNSANHGEEKQRSATGRAAAFFQGKWQLAHDPQPGASGNGGSFIPSFADSMAERFKVPIGIVAAGIGATSVREWLPRGTRLSNPPTLTGNVRQLATGDWESTGTIFENFTSRLREFSPHGFRAVLWHQGESDANQKDPGRTLAGELYRQYVGQLIQQSRREVGWDFPWFVAQASYHGPEDTGSADIRAAQRALWDSGVALEGPDTDALIGDLRDQAGKGVHFSGAGLREHGARWVDKVSPWLENQLAKTDQKADQKTKIPGPSTRLGLAGADLLVEGHDAFVLLPAETKRANPLPWIFYAPTLPGLPDQAEKWMHERFLAAGIAVAGVDAGEAYGNSASHKLFNALYRELTENRGFAKKCCLLGRSRGGLWVSSWAIAFPDRIAGLAGIYPVFDLRTYPGLTNAAPAYGLTPAELDLRANEFNPITRVPALARARIPAILIHGDSDKVVPLKENSAAFVRSYQQAGAGSLVKLIVVEGQGHNFFEGFFHSQALVDFAIECARAGARP
jgi:hypothetical protein